MYIWNNDGLHERAIGGHSDLHRVGCECQDVGKHVHCVCVCVCVYVCVCMCVCVCVHVRDPCWGRVEGLDSPSY